jgi:ADP-heptose:LPS heptosyltransferase
LTAACGCFDEFYEFNADPFSLRKAAETRKLEEWLGEQGFDAALILLGDQFAGLLAKAGIPVRVGVRGTALENCLTHTYDIGSPRTWGANERLNAVRSLGYNVDNAVPRLTPDLSLRPELERKLKKLGLASGERYLVLHPFGSSKRQWWELDKIPAFAAEIGEKFDLRVVLAGGDKVTLSDPGDSKDAIVNTTGILSLAELLLLIDGSALVVTTDSGPFHIAGALATPAVGLFRSRRPEHSRQYPTATVVFGRDDGCMNACEWDKCRLDPCRQMTEIAVDDVVEAVGARLSNL